MADPTPPTTYYVYGIEINGTARTALDNTSKSKTYRCVGQSNDENIANAIATRMSLIYPEVKVTTTKETAHEEGSLEPGYAI